MSTTHDLEDALEDALIVWCNKIATHGVNLSGFNLRLSEQDATIPLTLPAIIFHAQRQAEEINTGVWEININVTMRMSADDTTSANIADNWNKLITVMYWDNLAAELTTSTIKTFACRFTKPWTHEAADRHWEYSYDFTVWSGEI